MPLLEVERLNAFYGKAQVLRDVSIAVDEGEAVAVLGPNGAGKTTLLNSICGLVRADGRIVFDGRDISALKPHERIKLGIAISPEGRRLFPEMSVEDNLLIAGDSNKLDFVYNIFPNLKEKRKQKAKNLSGGEQQMIAIARALMLEPRLLLLDEPSMGLAPIVVENIAERIETIKEELGISILLVEQNTQMAFDVADRFYILASGQIVREGTIEEMEEIEQEYFG
ncbi:ABC transporter ATP-binding protein [Archaeoglobus fulgidus]|uniref:Branched-chain amino acid ABC transporter, ATP-binding protein (BraG-1) n=3 Tax=Archaeoglobus fulgidus TaxID=2234 RepID=O30018_ARCFU|nr:ABC transporter ATP-binding protein [Archaeoglobus fulgidus]AAB91011.1 branched-chain amino acid ABC transporter, ATP-binding protein (braG-1) [Archaeoglobus fulgidus DSM 4304]AIG97039.1 ABC-type branched-chain amino acid transport system, ATPase component [Archaeoglobus fulgidus DSM 8774]KUJ94542.1 MAG: Branched-chain amino acid ABC transporter, ATP-binding protein (BraG-1) [Archaeoglobus fulgidus]KUK07606.1 MAG: Branched-chain amino acid ABC transporter, ATP-binding protein (BraG-1) [Archa